MFSKRSHFDVSTCKRRYDPSNWDYQDDQASEVHGERWPYMKLICLTANLLYKVRRYRLMHNLVPIYIPLLENSQLRNHTWPTAEIVHAPEPELRPIQQVRKSPQSVLVQELSRGSFVDLQLSTYKRYARRNATAFCFKSRMATTRINLGEIRRKLGRINVSAKLNWRS